MAKKRVKGVTRVGSKPASRRAPDNSISLPQKENVPPDDLLAYPILLFGEKGIGKTSLCAEVGYVLCQWEPRRRNLRVKQIPKPGEPRLDWERFRSYVDLFVKEHPLGVAIDTVDRCYGACLQWVCAAKGIRHPNDTKDFGATWADVRGEFGFQIERLLWEDIGVVFVSHARFREVATRTGDTFDRVVPTCTPQAYDVLKGICDLVIYFGYYGSERSLTVRGDELVDASSPFDDHFMDPDGEPLQTFPAGESPKEAWANLQKAWSNKLHGYEESDEAEST